MYKRINKHIKKKEREEALGLDEETKEILGLHETDSDESDSSDEEQSDVGSSTPGSDEESEEGRAPSARGSVELRRKWEEGGTDGGSSSQAGEEDSEGENEGSEGEDEEEDNDPPPMTVSEALNQPLYSVRKGSDARACIMCPGKELKHAKMASIHVASSTHLRRMKRFATLAARVSDENEDPRLLVAALDKSVRIVPKENTIGASTEHKVSKRERRLAKRQRRRERRSTEIFDSKPLARSDPQLQRQSTKGDTNSSSVADRVLQKKLLSRQLEAISKHKKAKSNLQKVNLHKS